MNDSEGRNGIRPVGCALKELSPLTTIHDIGEELALYKDMGQTHSSSIWDELLETRGRNELNLKECQSE